MTEKEKKERIKAEIEQINFQLKEYNSFVSSEEYKEGYTPCALKARRDFLYELLNAL